ncbi:MAG: DUF2971 domain-containing protein [Pseudomonadota bacterium]
MTNQPKTFYRYRAFSTTTLDSLCYDTLFFSHPGAFNDPLDCSPTLSCDSNNDDLRKLLAFFFSKRVSSEVLSHLSHARIRGNTASEHATKRARRETENELANIAYNATNPDYEGALEENESWLLMQAIECELRRWYERGVCCFSTSYSNPLLWSHYGDQHQGICIGYSTKRNPVPQLQKVIYGGSRAIRTSILCDAFLHNAEKAMVDLDRDVLLRKASGWKYESEWRLIGKQGLQDSPLLLTEVVFGLRCPPSIIHSVIKAIEGREKEVRFYEMHEVRDSFSLRRRLVDVDELQVSLPVTAASGIEMFGPYECEDTSSNNT